MPQLELLKLLVDKKVADSFQFFTSCQYKLGIAELNYRALKNLVNKYQKEETAIVNEVFENAKKTGIGKYKSHKNMVDFFGIEIDTTIAIEMLFMEIMGLLHSFFDTFAQWVNSSLLGERALPIGRASLVNIINKIPDFPEYANQFVTDFLDITTNQFYVYISDLNNTQKHRYQLHIQNKFDILNIQGEVNTPNFKKDSRTYTKIDVIDIVSDCLDYCNKLIDDSKKYIIDYYSNNDCKYVEHRVYNPKAYLYFENEEDFKQLKNAKNHYYYIEIDKNNVLPQYQIMLINDNADADNDKNKSIEVFNCIYPIIMLKDSRTEEIIGILKPEDEEEYKFGDEHNIIYRKYKSITSDYQYEMYQAICSDTFNWLPVLSETTIVYNIEDHK